MYSRWDCGYPNRGLQGLPWRFIWWCYGNGLTCSWDGTLEINSRLLLLGMDTYPGSSLAPQRSKGVKNRTHILNEVARGELVYVYVYTDGEPPSQLTVSFDLLGAYPLTIRSQSDHSPIYSPITVRSQSDHMFYYHFTLLAWKEFTDLKGDPFFPVKISSCW